MISQKQKAATESNVTGRVSQRQLLVLAIVVAVVLRLVSAVYQGNEVAALPGVWDQLSYDGLAQRVVAGYGFNFAEDHWPATRAGEPTAHWSYLYTLYLSAVYAIFGYQPLVARVIQALIAGVLQTWFTWRIGRRIFGPAAGLVGAAISAVYIYFFYYGGSLLTESFYFVGILWTLDAAMRSAGNGRPTLEKENRRPNKWQWLELGLAVGVTVLLRQMFLLFVPFLFLWIWWNLPQSSEQSSSISKVLHWPALKGLAVTTLVVAFLIIPWTIRNYRAFDILVPLNTNAGFAFFWGNHPIHGTDFIPLLGIDDYYSLIPEELLPLSEAEIDRALLRQGIGFVTDQPLRIALLSLSRVQEYFKFWPTAESGTISNVARVASFGLTLPFMFYGLWLSVKLVRRPQFADQSMQIILLYLFMIVYAGVHLLSWTLVRYRLPVDAVLLIFAGLGIADILARIGFGANLPEPNPGISNDQ